MSTLNEFLARLANLDVKLWADAGKLRCSAPEHVMTRALQAELGARKAELLAFLTQAKSAEPSHDLELAPRLHDGDIPLSAGQERIWTLSQMRPTSSVYNISTAFRIVGGLDISVLEKSLNELQKRHEILRTCFPLATTGRPRQEILPVAPLLLPVTDIFRDMRRLPPERQEMEAKKLLLQEVWQPFDLKAGPLWRVRLFRLKGRPTSWWRSRLQWYKQEEYILSLTMHHMIFDGSSKYILLNELALFYNALQAGREPGLSALPLQYADFAVWRECWQHSGEAARQLNYWKRKFSGGVSELRVFADKPRASSAHSGGGNLAFELPQELASAVDRVCREERTSQYVVLLSAFCCLLHGYTGQQQFVICSPLASRNRAELEGLIGYFNNILPILADLGGKPSFRDVVGRLKKAAVEALENQNTPLQEISEFPSLARVPLNRAMFSFQDTSSRTLDLAGVTTTPIDVRKESADFDLAMYMERSGASLGGILEYNADILEAATIQQMVANYRSVLEQVLAEPDIPLAGMVKFGLEAERVAQILEAYPKIDRAVVVRLPGQSRLAAYLVLNEYDVPEIEEIRSYAKSNLPDYLVPAAFLPLDQIPVDAAGAVDYRALPVPGRLAAAGKAYVAPRTELEKRLASVWKKVLWLDQEVGIHDHFLELGGHSLLSVQLILALEKELDRPLPEQAITRLGTIAEMATLIEQPADTAGNKESSDSEGTGSGLPAGVLRELHSYTASWEGKRLTSDSIIVGLNIGGGKQALFWCLQRNQELSQLAKYLGPEQPVYGMRSGNRVMVKTAENIRALAEYYVTEILQVQSQGPFLLGGNCQAANIAFQIADKLRELGHDITLLILHEKFVPLPYSGRVSLMFGADSDHNPRLYFKNPEQGWGKYYTGGFTLDIVPGTHGKFFQEPNIQALCAKLQQRIEEARGSRPARDTHYNAVTAGRLPTSAYRARISVQQRLSAEPGQEISLRVAVENASSELWRASETSSVYASSRWLNAKGKAIDSLGPRAPLPADLEPGQKVDIEVPVRCPNKGGEWILELDMVDEGVAWFGDHGSAPARVEAGVRRARSGWYRIMPWWRGIRSKSKG